MENDSFRVHLQETLIKRCQDNSSYSLRAFARDLEIDNSVLSKVLSGRRPLGKKLIERLGCKLNMDPESLNTFLKPSGQPKQDRYGQLAMDSFSIISDWHHYAILELMRLDDYQHDKKWMATKLGMKVPEVSAALDRLIRVGLVEEQKGQWLDISGCLLYTSPSPRDATLSRMPSSA